MADGRYTSMNKKRNELKIVVYNVKNRKVEDIVWCARYVMMLSRYFGRMESFYASK